MKNSLLLVRLPTLAFFVFAIAITGCAVKIVKALTPEDIQQLEDVKGLFESQMKDDMHPVIWAYLDEILHDPDSFRLQRFEYIVKSRNKFTFYEIYVSVIAYELFIRLTQMRA